ncbi:hypothetical protein [Lysobacter gummosus]|uniref:hypothetical protein n=1 Tax=Lysobacter gummosus TaxID=262324 RepID=UPI0036305CF4
MDVQKALRMEGFFLRGVRRRGCEGLACACLQRSFDGIVLLSSRPGVDDDSRQPVSKFRVRRRLRLKR